MQGVQAVFPLIPLLVFAEQIVNGIVIIWDLDGKQRCTNADSFSKDGYKISKNIKRFNDYNFEIVQYLNCSSEDMCEYIREHAAPSDFEHFEDMVDRLEKAVTDDGRFIDFMAEFSRPLHGKRSEGYLKRGKEKQNPQKPERQVFVDSVNAGDGT